MGPVIVREAAPAFRRLFVLYRWAVKMQAALLTDVMTAGIVGRLPSSEKSEVRTGACLIFWIK